MIMKVVSIGHPEQEKFVIKLVEQYVEGFVCND